MNVSRARLFAFTLAHDSRRLAEHLCERLQPHSGKSSRDEDARVLAKLGGFFAVCGEAHDIGLNGNTLKATNCTTGSVKRLVNGLLRTLKKEWGSRF
jgi:hypothetical protein